MVKGYRSTRIHLLSCEGSSVDCSLLFWVSVVQLIKNGTHDSFQNHLSPDDLIHLNLDIPLEMDGGAP
jgi:hypothetical protein